MAVVRPNRNKFVIVREVESKRVDLTTGQRKPHFREVERGFWSAEGRWANTVSFALTFDTREDAEKFLEEHSAEIAAAPY